MVNGAHARAVFSTALNRKCVIKVHLRSINSVGPGVVSILRYPTTHSGGTNPYQTIHGENHSYSGGGDVHYLAPSRNYHVVGVMPGNKIQTFIWPGPPSTSSPPQDDMETAWNSTSKATAGLAFKHISVGQVNGQDLVLGTGDSGDFNVHNVITKTSRVLANVPSSSNPGSCASALAWQDTFNKYGVPADGSGVSGSNAGVSASTSLLGPRYVVVSKSGSLGAGGIWAFRLGPDDFDGGGTAGDAKCRYLAHPMGTEYKYTFPTGSSVPNGIGSSSLDDDCQADANVSPDGRFVVFVSRYDLLSSRPAAPEATPYVIELPPGWFSQTNSSTPG